MFNSETIQGIVRHAITTFGGFLITSGYTNASGLEALAGGAAVVVGIIWSIVSKRA